MQLTHCLKEPGFNPLKTWFPSLLSNSTCAATALALTRTTTSAGKEYKWIVRKPTRGDGTGWWPKLKFNGETLNGTWKLDQKEAAKEADCLYMNAFELLYSRPYTPTDPQAEPINLPMSEHTPRGAVAGGGGTGGGGDGGGTSWAAAAAPTKRQTIRWTDEHDALVVQAVHDSTAVGQRLT
jgi:hypothetical protein